VAKRADVGVGTVSRVLNGSPLVSEATRTRVQGIIDELGYLPSRAAQALSRGTEAAVAVVAPYFTSPSVMMRLRGIADGLHDLGLDLVLHAVDEPVQRDARLASVVKGTAAGVIVVSFAAGSGDVERLQGSGVPIVFVDRRVEGLPHVFVDDVEGGRLATSHLVGMGHTRIAFVGDRFDDGFGFTSSADRARGYRLALSEAGLPYDPHYERVGRPEREEASRLTADLFGTSNPPTAVFAASDLQAIGVIEAVRAAGMSVPGDVSVIGFDDIFVARHIDLTTVRQPLVESGQIAVAMLGDLMGGKQPESASVALETRVVTRSTTAPP